MDVRFSLGGVTTSVNIMAMTTLHHVMDPLLLIVYIFALVIVFVFSV